MPALRVIAAAVVEAGRLLVVSKRAAPSVYYMPGGKPDPAEPALGCLTRELREELGVGIAGAEHLIDVRAPAALERIDMHMSVFVARLTGTPRAMAEIASLAWWPDGDGLVLAPAVRDHVIPALRAGGRI